MSKVWFDENKFWMNDLFFSKTINPILTDWYPELPYENAVKFSHGDPDIAAHLRTSVLIFRTQNSHCTQFRWKLQREMLLLLQFERCTNSSSWRRRGRFRFQTAILRSRCNEQRWQSGRIMANGCLKIYLCNEVQCFGKRCPGTRGRGKWPFWRNPGRFFEESASGGWFRGLKKRKLAWLEQQPRPSLLSEWLVVVLS